MRMEHMFLSLGIPTITRDDSGRRRPHARAGLCNRRALGVVFGALVLATWVTPVNSQTCAAPFTTTPVPYPVDSAGGSVATGEFSGDVLQDFAVGRANASAISVYTRNILYPDLFLRWPDAPGGGTVRASDGTPIFSTAISALATGDFVEDGRTDFVVAHPDTNVVTVVERRPTQSVEFGPTFSRVVGRAPTDVAVADFDADGRLDVVVASGDPGLQVHLGDGNGLLGAVRRVSPPPDSEVTIELVAPTLLPTTNPSRDLVVADVDADGWPDIVAAGGSGIEIFRNFLGENTGGPAYHDADNRVGFFARRAVTLSFPVAAVAAGNLDRDFVPEIVAASGSNDRIVVLRADGQGAWTQVADLAKSTATATPDKGLWVGDFTGDGVGDIVAASLPNAQASITVLAGDGAGGFRPPVGSAPGVAPTSLAAALLNTGNSALDLVVVDSAQSAAQVLANGCTVPAVNISVSALEVTQAIQDLANSVPLIAGKATFVRAHVATDTGPVEGVTARLRGYGPGGVSLGDALMPVNAGGRITVKPQPDRGRRDDSFLFRLPDKWTAAGQVQLEVSVNGAGEIPESNVSDDLKRQTVEFLDTRKLRVQVWRYAYPKIQGQPCEDDPSACFEPTDEAVAAAQSLIRRMFPAGAILFETVRKPDNAPKSFLYEDRNLGGSLDPTKGAFNPTDTNTWPRIWHLQQDLKTKFPELTTPGTLKVVLIKVSGELIGIGDNPGWFSVTVNDAPYIAVHEVGHNMGRYHVLCSKEPDDEKGPDDAYPYQYPDYPTRVWGGIGGNPLSEPDRFYGFDAGDMSLQWPALTTPIAPLRPAGSEEPVVGDLMSYCAKRWISDYSYRALREFLQQNFSPNDPVGDFLRVVGGIGNAASGRASFSATRLYQVPDLPAQTPGSYTIRLEGADGAVLASYPFTPTQAHDQGLLNVTEIVGFRVGTRRVVLVGPTGQELGAVPVSAAAPVVSLGPINTVLPASGVTPIAWSATDADGDGLLATIEYSADSGAHWSALATGVRGTQFDLANAELAGTHGAVSGRVRVLVSDGVHTGQSDSVPISVEGKPPSLRIVTVADGATFSLGQNVPLVAVASDLEDGSLLPIEWSSDRDGALGAGAGISPVLSAGTHVISATATDSDGARADQLVTVFVQAAPAPGHAPVANAGSNQNATEGDLVQLNGSGSSDADDDPLLYAWSIDQQPAVGGETGTALSGSGPFSQVRVLEDGTHRFLLQVDDQRHGIASDDVTVNVQNSVPAVQVTSPADGALFKVGSVTVTAAFTDRGAFDTHACSITWDVGGGLTDTGAMSDGGANGTCTVTRSLSAGVYDTQVFVSDDDRGVGNASVQIVVYDPNGGFVTGGAQIASAPGALRTAPSASGLAALGFVAKYQKDTSTVPTGELNFELPAGNLNVHSEKYQWIALSGGKATLRGTALVNQSAGYTFQVEIQDGQYDTTGIDRVRMKVWRTASGAIVYDNGSLTNLSSGSIVLHK